MLTPPPLPMCIRVVPCCKNTISLSHFIQFQHYGEKETLAYREMKLLLPGGGGAGGIINWGGRVQKKFFFARGRWCRRHYQLRWQGAKIYFFARGKWCRRHFQLRWQGAKPFFRFDTFFDIQFKNTLNLIFPSFKVPSKSFLFKNFKTGLTFWHMWFFNFQNLVRSC